MRQDQSKAAFFDSSPAFFSRLPAAKHSGIVKPFAIRIASVAEAGLKPCASQHCLVAAKHQDTKGRVDKIKSLS
jgi:hypothetical protein